MPQRKTESVDKLIKAAFIELMNRKYYMDITVTDLVKEAGIARASFYRNYGSTNDVLTGIIDDIAAAFEETFPVLGSNDTSAWREFLFRFIYDFRSRQKKLMTNNPINISVILFRLNERFSRLQSEMNPVDLNEKYRRFARVGLILMVLKGWIDTGMKETTEELVNYLMGLIPGI